MLLSFGLASCLGVALLTWRMKLVGVEDVPKGFMRRMPGYLAWLSVEVVKSNWAVAKLIVSPKLTLTQTLLYVRWRQKSAIGVVTYANSITLTPGTVSLDVRDGRILVHALTEDMARDLVGGEMNRRAARLEA